jgi:heme-degrading monooxygenase HmoA
MPASPWHQAQINIGRIIAPLDDPGLADFVNNLDRINALADHSPGFVWRFQTASGNATDERPYEDDRILISFSVWEDLESLRAFTYRSDHTTIMRRRRE